MTNQQIDQIEKYHSGNMSEAEIAEFKKQLSADPSMKAESDMQADIVSGLKEYRKLELKTRLDAINVGPTWLEFVGQSALVKSMGGIIVASLVGTGIYLVAEKGDDTSYDASVSIDAPAKESIDYVWDLGLEGGEGNPENGLEELAIVEETTKAVASTEKAEFTNNEVVAEASSEDQKTFTPSFEAPSISDVNDETKFTSDELDALPDAKTSAKTEDPIDVETTITKSKSIKYKYYDGKLFLSGDFDEAPYEILEINNSGGRSIYVYYLGTYYQVNTTDRLTELPEVEDQNLIKELVLLKANK